MVIKNIIRKIGKITSWLSLGLVFLISLDVLLRYIFNFSVAAMYEMEWHIFAIIFLLASPLTLQKNKHVRVDVFYNTFSKRKKNFIDLI
jgi:TRAP-type mannitol/chloroaromatic compound transport system permease small subunit